MAVVFGKPQTAKQTNRPVLADVFERDLTVLDETDADSGSANGALRVVTNYRGFTKDKAGRKASLIHQTVIDLAPIGQAIPLAELPDLIARLQKVQADIEEAGVLAGKGNPLLGG